VRDLGEAVIALAESMIALKVSTISKATVEFESNPAIIIMASMAGPQKVDTVSNAFLARYLASIT